MPQIAYVSTYVPKKCGLATYTHHLREAINCNKGSRSQDLVVPLCNLDEMHSYKEPWMLPISKLDQHNYGTIAEALNQSTIDIVSLQHEFGIFGGEGGNYVLDFLKELKKPVVTTFHTVFEHPVIPYHEVQREIAELSNHLIVMNRKGIGYLQHQFTIAPDKVSYIPHGSPVPNQADRTLVRRNMGWNEHKVLFTFGLLGRSKGIELVLNALAAAVHAVPELQYVIAGQTHPEVLRYEGEAYREELKTLTQQLGIEHHVQWIDRYVPEAELTALIAACDLYVTPYPGMGQITSGTLAYAAGLGRPILSTPYEYAKDLLQGYDAMLLPYGNVEAWGAKLIEVFSYPGMLAKWEQVISEIGHGMHWPQVGALHLRLFQRVLSEQRGKIAYVG
ncbi:MAG: glycosyltransferase [Candidatus Cohnella colombiensis]|uniref:Glycosyltransferase n=1 Tax=Candidatus Cohnella colombiensis TaxID=3121368 RepID=A0AA95F2B5_9BACL|nr:MAG: glycosyltransferase [Cohnella sp.]